MIEQRGPVHSQERDELPVSFEYWVDVEVEGKLLEGLRSSVDVLFAFDHELEFTDGASKVCMVGGCDFVEGDFDTLSVPSQDKLCSQGA